MLCSCLLPMLIPVGLVVFFRILNKPRKPAIFGVYQQKNKFYWIKFLFMYTTLRIKQLFNHLYRLYTIESGKSCDGTQHVHKQDEALEKKYYLDDYRQAIDAVYFNGNNKEGDAVICRIARRPKNAVDALLYLKVKGEDLLLSPELPDTYQEQVTVEEGLYRIKGLEVVNFIPMRTWKLNYKGEMKPKNDKEKTVQVEAELTWSAVFSPFSYNTQMSPISLARDMARHKWSFVYFRLLKKLYGTHYEQMGALEGTVTIDGKQHIIDIPCVRDHSFGPFRDYRTFHRYVYHYIFLENGDCMTIGSVCLPVVLSHLTIGYLCRQSDQAVLPVDSCDFKLYQHGEHHILPRDYGFTFEAGGKSYAVCVQVDSEDTFYIGKGREAKFYERWCSVEVNGVKGSASVEWHYNNVQANSACNNCGLD